MGGKLVDAVDERLLGVRQALFVPVVAFAAVNLVALLATGGRGAKTAADAAADPAEKQERERTVHVVALGPEHAVDGVDAFENTGGCHGGDREKRCRGRTESGKRRNGRNGKDGRKPAGE